ncbi:glycoside hydrolase family 32 protein [Anaerophaga thermohalophila]|uniref:glycoside hydrolase family 32 protein n=1 Tax=Anaerophaga thermohalophila TaxID=177400 RepID=UPI000237D353|nr:glycoside hydrolase family 32 protein [Anaerophaga thermohalophila]
MRYISIFLLLGMFGLAASCNDENNSDKIKEEPNVDLSTQRRYPQEVGGYDYFFRPQHTWVGDPMPFYESGTYYVFYLQDERPASDQFHPWHLVETTDASSYDYKGEAIPCGETYEQDIAIGTGSVIKKNGVYYAFYTGHKWNHAPDQPKEAVMVATSTDLYNWKKNDDFILYADPGYDQNEFRDPYLLYDESNGEYIMLVSTRLNNKATLAKYVSTDLINWELDLPFYSDDSVFMIECVDIFEMNGKWYFIYSNINDRKVHYLTSDSFNGQWKKPQNDLLDGSAYYAAKSASDGQERLLFGWCPTRINDDDSNDYNWGGSLVVHSLNADETGALETSMPPALNKEFNQDATWGVIQKTEGSFEIENGFELNSNEERQTVWLSRMLNPHKIETNVTFDEDAKNFGFVFGATTGLESVYALHIDVNEELLKLAYLSDWNSDNTTYEVINTLPVEVSSKNELKIKILIEGSVCVTYIDGEKAFTNRIYKMAQNPWMLFSDTGNVVFDNFTVTVSE